jgi:hypothetical protein
MAQPSNLAIPATDPVEALGRRRSRRSSIKYKQSDYRAYFFIIGIVTLSLLTAVGALNYIVDPYFIHQWNTELIDRSGPRQPKITPWAKTYAAFRYRPEVVYLGSSRTEIGLPAQTELFKNKRVLNLALSGGTQGDAINMLSHTSGFHRPEIVVWGLEYGWLFTDSNGNTDFNRSLIFTNSLYPLWRFLINIKRCLSNDMTMDTFKILAGTSEQDCPSILSTYGQEPEQCVERNMEVDGGTAKAFEKTMQNVSKTVVPESTIVMGQLDKVTENICEYGTQLRFFIQPNHALSELHYLSQWEKRENWQRALVKLIDRRKAQGCDIRLLDFSGFNDITTEEIPQKTGRETMRYYWEQSHYRSEVGRMVLARLFSDDRKAEPSEFGVELNGKVIEQHLENMRSSRDRYLKSHPMETRHF